MLSQPTELIQMILDETDKYTKLNFSYTNQTTILYFSHMVYKEHYFVHNEKFGKNQKSKIMKLKNFHDLYQLKDYENLTHLTFIMFFDQNIKINTLPKGLTHLTFEYHSNFNQPIEHDVLPKSLTHLTFGCYFNQNIKSNILPEGLTHLTFGMYFNQPIEHDVLPKSLTHLTFGYFFNQNIKSNILPKGLIEIKSDSNKTTFDTIQKNYPELKIIKLY